MHKLKWNVCIVNIKSDLPKAKKMCSCSFWMVLTESYTFFQWPQPVVAFPPTKAGSFARGNPPKNLKTQNFPTFLLIEISFSWLEIHPQKTDISHLWKRKHIFKLAFWKTISAYFGHVGCQEGMIYSNLFHIYTDTCLFTVNNIYIYRHIYVCVCTFFNAPILTASWTSQHSTEVQWIEMLRRNAIAMESDPMRSNFLQLCHGLRASWLLKVGF